MGYTTDSNKLRNHFSNRINSRGFKELYELYNYLNKIKLLEYNYNIYKIPQEQINKNESLYNNNFISNKILKKTEELLITKHINIKIGDISIIVNIYSKNKIKDSFIKSIIHYIRYTCSLMCTKVNNIVINYYLTNEKKKLMNNNLPSINEINSGSCLNIHHKKIINIWRKEEILKVTIHELFHALDYSEFNDTEYIIKYYQEKYGITSNIININESYIEIWANIINCFIISQMLKNDNYNNFKQMIGLEKYFSFYQANKILNKIEKYPNINKDTNIMAYYIIRAELYNNFKNFIKFCKLNNKKYIKINDKKFFQFLKTGKKLPIIKIEKDKFKYIYRLSLNEYNPFY